ncbi:MAG TPA: S1 RNA-binding domain-containing protein [bacterium]|nr:S1 RNA-binding domain-containing protein [bacterium]
MKRLNQDPWQEAISKFKIGDVITGEVQKVVDYGAFVRIGKGLNGLIHISEMSDSLVKDPNDYVKEGEKVNVKILTISTTERHLGLSLKAVGKSTPVRQKQPYVKKEISRENLEDAIAEEIK